MQDHICASYSYIGRHAMNYKHIISKILEDLICSLFVYCPVLHIYIYIIYIYI